MRYIKYLAWSIVFSIMFTGCANKPNVVYVPKTEVKYKHLPKHFYVDNIKLPTPPDKDAFINGTPDKRESMLTKYIIELYRVISKYKLKIKKIGDYESKVKEVTNK